MLVRIGPAENRRPRPQTWITAAAVFALLAVAPSRPAAADEPAATAAPPAPVAQSRELRPDLAERGPDPVYTVKMEASFDPADRRIKGHERLRWRNTASVPVSELQFHLYLNAFANNRTTFVTESGGQLRGVTIPKDKWAWVEVTSMRTADGADLKASEQFIQPDDGNPDDRTVARYPLPAPLAPGEWVELDIAYDAQLPGVFARNGVQNDYALGGQWFPKIAVFEDAGVRGRAEPGWNAHQYHANSEFYADFGDYDVTLTLPIRYQGHIGASGRMVEESATADQVTARFVQEGVNDFAWTGDPNFVVINDRFDPERDVPREQQARIAGLLGVPAEQIALLPVDITLLVQPANLSQAPRYIESLKTAIAGYGLRLGAYPYPHFTMVDPPRGAMGSAGMEYLTFITLGSHPLFATWPLDKLRAPEMVTIHEFGHNYWMGMSASNEFEESWLDEGINSYYDMIVGDETYGAMIDLLGMTATSFDSNHSSLGPGRYADPIARESWNFRPGASYAFNSYSRPAVTLRHLEGLVGTATFHRAMRHVFQTWKYRHMSTADFERTFQEAAGQDLGWFFTQAFHSTRALDYTVRTATSVAVKKDRGYFWRDGKRELVGEDEEKDGTKTDASGDEQNSAGKPADTPKPTPAAGAGDTKGGDAETAGDDYRSAVIVERWGEFIHPVTVELRFADDHVERRQWDGAERWVRYQVVRPAKLVSAEVDPDRVMALDVNRLNNSRLVEPRHAASTKMVVHILFWLQNLLAATALVG
jgi:hypothetical protein